MRRKQAAGIAVLCASLALNAFFLLRPDPAQPTASPPAWSPREADPPPAAALEPVAGVARAAEVSTPRPAATDVDPAAPAPRATPPLGDAIVGAGASATLEIPVDAVIATLAENRPTVDRLPLRDPIAFLVALLGGPEHVGALVDSLANGLEHAEGDQLRARLDLLKRLQGFAGLPAGATRQANAAIVRALGHHADSHDQRALLEALRAPADPAEHGALRDAVAPLLRSERFWVRQAAVDVLADLRTSGAMDDLAFVIGDERERIGIRAAAIRQLDVRSAQGLAIVLDVAHHPHDELRGAALGRLGQATPDEALPVLHAALPREASPYVRKQILGALSVLGAAESVAVLQAYAERAADDDERERVMAIVGSIQSRRQVEDARRAR